ncbi:hypothetical protein EUGRSUZ_L03384 [Eucalyptus grandis]|uniref:Mechanosensitive ion channel MscS domain-containing protein n=1 Tax=Eucalyptus grandis TaxID=71139 RepID=A0AAD9T771_EUCGR|nr:hypothetical protein EUGRSUZ_L03384 [Eucalyptus grandis]
MEPPHPSDTSASASKGAVELALSKSPVSSVPSPAVEDEDDEDVCETVNPKSQVMSGSMKFILAQLVMFVCITGLLIASLTIRVLRNTVIWHVHLLVSFGLIALLISLIERKYALKRNVLYFLVALKDSAEVFAWLGAALWLIKTFLIRLLFTSSQCKRFFDRLEDAIFRYHVIRKLSNPVGKKTSPKVNIEKLRRMKLDEVVAWMTKMIKDIKGWELSTLTHSLGEAQQQDKEITDEQKAKDAAKAIFNKVAKSGSQFIEENELLHYIPKEHVEKFLAFFPEAKETRKIRKSFFKSWLVVVNREQKSLIRGLKDTKTAIEELDNLASAVLLVVVIILWLLLTGLLTTQVLIFISSQLLLLEFIFGDFAKGLFGAIVFVFVIHPFDVGDHCLVDGDELEVEEMNIMTTVFLTKDGEKKSYPNSVLASKPISNYSRSANMSESLEFVVDLSTSVESLEDLRNKIREYIEEKSKHWHQDHSVEFKEIAEVDNSRS